MHPGASEAFAAAFRWSELTDAGLLNYANHIHDKLLENSAIESKAVLTELNVWERIPSTPPRAYRS